MWSPLESLARLGSPRAATCPTSPLPHPFFLLKRRFFLLICLLGGVLLGSALLVPASPVLGYTSPDTLSLPPLPQASPPDAGSSPEIAARAVPTDTEQGGPSLTLTKSDGATTVLPGETLTYFLVVRNQGDGPAVGVVLSDTLPAHTSFLAASSGATEAGGVVTWPPFDLASGVTISHTLTILVGEGGGPGGYATLGDRVWEDLEESRSWEVCRSHLSGD